MKKYFDTFLKGLKNIDEKISKIMEKGFKFSLIVGILGILTLILYKYAYISYDLIEASIILFKTGLLFTIQFFVCGYTIDTVRKLNSQN